MSILDLFQSTTKEILPIFLVVFVIGFVFGIVYFFFSLWNNKRKERKIEKTIAKTGSKYEDVIAGFLYDMLKKSDILSNTDELPVQSILFPDGAVLDNGIKGTIEIDMAFATTKGIFVTECKHRHGYMTGTIAGDTWSDDRSRFKNPLLQNENHIRILRKNLIESAEFRAFADIPIYNLFVTNVPVIINKMGRKETLDGVAWDNQNHIFVIMDKNSTQTRKALTNCISLLEDIISVSDADRINRYLTSYRGNEAAMREHVKYVKTLHPED